MKRLLAALTTLIGFSGLFSGASAGTLMATLTTKALNDTTSQFEIRFEKPITDELLLWAWQVEFPKRFSLPVRPSSPGVYRFTAPITEGQWRYYLRVGPGQAGYISREGFWVGKTEDSAPIVLYNQFEDTVPTYVQPLGYAVWAIFAALALGLTGVVLSRLSRRTQAI